MNDKKYSEIFTVEENDCISKIDTSLPNLLGTYTLVKWMEIVCAKSINRKLNNQFITVGKKVSIEHTDMVKLNESVEIISLIIDEGKRNIKFEIEAISNGKIIATASHHRIKIPVKIISRFFKET